MPSRETLEIIEIDMSFCGNVYGQAPCTASLPAGNECHNTFRTCQDPANFARTTRTVRYSKNQNTGIRDQIIFPALKSVSTVPNRISLSNADKRYSGLGRRARVTVTLEDFKDPDYFFDPYRATRSYDPSRGTHFGKLKARWPYYEGAALRHKFGYVGDNLATMKTLHYVITEWKGPDANGVVQLIVQDPLKLFDEEFSLCPKPSKGSLSAAIDASFVGQVAITPPSIGSTYPASGRARIGREIVTYTMAGDVMTITGRGVDNTTPAAHEIDAAVQACQHWFNAQPEQVILELARDFAGLDPSFLPFAEWEAELGRWAPSVILSRTISEPTPVADLIAEILQLGLSGWWDPQQRKFKIKANRPADLGETFENVTETNDIVAKSSSRQTMDEQRLTEVEVYHAIEDPTQSVTNKNSYKRVTVNVGGNTEYSRTRTLTVFMPWLGLSGNDSVTIPLAARLVHRYRDPPERISFTLDAKDQDRITLGSLINMHSAHIQGITGDIEIEKMIVLQIEETDPGHSFQVLAERYLLLSAYGFITENTRPVYDASTSQQKEQGTYFSNGSNRFSDGRVPYTIF